MSILVGVVWREPQAMHHRFLTLTPLRSAMPNMQPLTAALWGSTRQSSAMGGHCAVDHPDYEVGHSKVTRAPPLTTSRANSAKCLTICLLVALWVSSRILVEGVRQLARCHMDQAVHGSDVWM